MKKDQIKVIYGNEYDEYIYLRSKKMNREYMTHEEEARFSELADKIEDRPQGAEIKGKQF